MGSNNYAQITEYALSFSPLAKYRMRLGGEYPDWPTYDDLENGIDETNEIDGPA